MLKNKDLNIISENEIKNLFFKTIDFLENCIGSEVFYPKKSFNTLLFESLMLLTPKGLEYSKFKKVYELLVNDQYFWSLTKHSTTSKKNLMKRLEYVEELYRDTHL
jgi:hypothetical protein